MDFNRPLRAFDHYQQSRRWLALPMAVIKKLSDDQGGNLASLVAYYGFFSLFPLLLVFTTILGFVLHGDPSAEQSVEHTVVGQLPIIGSSLHPHGLTGSVTGLVFGLVTALLGGLGVTSAAQNALNTVWAVPFKHRPNFLKQRLRGLALLAFLGVLFVVSTGASGIVSGGFGGVLAKVAGYVVSLVVNFALFFAAYRLMTDRDVPSADLRWGSIVAGVLWTILQGVAGYYIGHVVKNDSNTYGTFATVIGVLVWLHLGGQVFLYSAELNVVLSRRLWPRSFFGPPDEPADRRTLRALAKKEERSDEQQVDVEFKTKT